jgi:hypothetical protein
MTAWDADLARKAMEGAQQLATVHPLPSAKDEAAAIANEAKDIDWHYRQLLEATIAQEHSRVDVILARIYRQGVSRERIEAELLRRWAESHGIDLSSHAPPARGRIIGKADPGAGIQQLQPGFVLDRDLHLLVADAGAGKTLLTLELATILSIGTAGFLDHQSPRKGGGNRRTILYIATDGGPTAYNQISDYCDELQVADRGAQIEVWAESEDGSEAGWSLTLPNLDRLAARVAEGDVLAVFIDTANAVFQQAGLSPYVGPVDQYLRLLKAIVCRHAVLWINTHSNRSGTGLKSIGGHPAWQEVPSVIHRIEPPKKGTDQPYRWIVQKLRGESHREFSYHWRGGEFVLAEGHYHENVDDELLGLIQRLSTAGMPTKPEALIEATSKSPQSIYSSLKRLRQARWIRPKGHKYVVTPTGERHLDY